ncbi:MAG: protein-glutamate O-methyltransferase CheR [archaeon]|nr:protein-glutamate O-methyltransferase CheR [archaeon]
MFSHSQYISDSPYKAYDPKLVKEIKDFLRNIRKFPVQNYTDQFFRRRIFVVSNKLDIGSLEDFVQIIKKDKAVADRLIKELSINVTQFFRNFSLWKFLEDEVFHKVFRRILENKGTFRIWSAGCATGQEPYSIAILLDRVFKRFPLKMKVEIIGADINQDALNYAKKGIYRKNEMEGIPKDILLQYFKYIPKRNEYEVDEKIKKMVYFRKMDLFTSDFPKKLDIIFCRNVVIYFNEDLKNRLYQRFQDSLKIGGFFIMGMTERLPRTFRKNFKLINLSERIYQLLPKEGSKLYKSSGLNKEKVKNLPQVEIRTKIQSEFDPNQKKLIRFVASTILHHNKINEVVLRGIINRIIKNWCNKNNQSAIIIINMPSNSQFRWAIKIYDQIKHKMKRISLNRDWLEIDKIIALALKDFKNRSKTLQ